MAGRAKKETPEKIELKGSEQIKNLQEKQIATLEKVHETLSKSVDSYNTAIDEAKKELNDLYYEIKEKEEYLDSMEISKTVALEGKLEFTQKVHDDKIEKLKKDIDDLQKTFEIKRKDFQVNFEIDLKSSKEKILKELLTEFGLAYISNEAFENINTSLSDAKVNTEKEIGKAIGIESRRHQAEVKELQLKHEKEQASNEAKIEQQSMQIQFLSEQVKEAKAQIQAILDNQVKVAEATKAINFAVGDGKK